MVRLELKDISGPSVDGGVVAELVCPSNVVVRPETLALCTEPSVGGKMEKSEVGLDVRLVILSR